MKFFIAIILNILLVNTFANNKLAIQDSSDITIITFDNSKSTQVARDKKGKIVRTFAKNNLKIGLLAPVFGEAPIYYERYLADWFTLKLGAGITFRDFLGDYYTKISFGSRSRYRNTSLNWTEPNEIDVDDEYTSYEHRKSGIGFCVSLEPRFFPSGDAFDEGLFVAPMIQYSIRNYKAQNVDVNGYHQKDSKMNEKASSILFMINIGYQHNFEPVIVDWYFGAGFARNSYLRQDIGYTYNNIDFTEVYGNKQKSFNSFTPYFKLSVDLGFAFGGKKKKKSTN